MKLQWEQPDDKRQNRRKLQKKIAIFPLRQKRRLSFSGITFKWPKWLDETEWFTRHHFVWGRMGLLKNVHCLGLIKFGIWLSFGIWHHLSPSIRHFSSNQGQLQCQDGQNSHTFWFGFFAFPNSSWKTIPSVKNYTKKASLMSQKLRICYYKGNSSFSINGWTEFDSSWIPAKSALSLLSSLWHKIVWLHTFSRNGWTEGVPQYTFCQSISQ